MKLLFILLFLPALSFAQLSVGNLLEAYSKREIPDSSFNYVIKRGYKIESVQTDSSGHSKVNYAKQGSSVEFSGTGYLTMLRYRTLDKGEFTSWDSAVLKQGYILERKYKGEGKHYFKYTRGESIIVSSLGLEDGAEVYYLMVLN